ncbi:hypothetical protein L484_008375 [Morus notabilis]|uniref:Uncharacterized protein n=1 Tax=Morus notabilis TaxID=981085 RepID=W9S842_9ROSA|nr:hypothetical protein L484_008375 [Morus notabilis]
MSISSCCQRRSRVAEPKSPECTRCQNSSSSRKVVGGEPEHNESPLNVGANCANLPADEPLASHAAKLER